MGKKNHKEGPLTARPARVRSIFKISRFPHKGPTNGGYFYRQSIQVEFISHQLVTYMEAELPLVAKM